MRFKILKIYSFNILYCLVIIALSSGCGNAVRYTLAPDYAKKMPNTVAVLPVVGEVKDTEARYLFRTLAQEKASQTGYSMIPLESIDEKLLSRGLGREGISAKALKELASILGADAVLYITVTEWDTTLFLTYASINVSLRAELYDGATGEKLWESDFSAEDSEVSLEKEVIELGIVKTYAPIIHRTIDAVFSTIPKAKTTEAKKNLKTYYDWLP